MTATTAYAARRSARRMKTVPHPLSRRRLATPRSSAWTRQTLLSAKVLTARLISAAILCCLAAGSSAPVDSKTRRTRGRSRALGCLRCARTTSAATLKCTATCSCAPVDSRTRQARRGSTAPGCLRCARALSAATLKCTATCSCVPVDSRTRQARRGSTAPGCLRCARALSAATLKCTATCSCAPVDSRTRQARRGSTAPGCLLFAPLRFVANPYAVASAVPPATSQTHRQPISRVQEVCAPTTSAALQPASSTRVRLGCCGRQQLRIQSHAPEPSARSLAATSRARGTPALAPRMC